MRHLTIIFAIIFALSAPALRADEDEDRTTSPTRIDRAPIIDGHLTDDVWAKATKIDNFIQQDPDFGQPATDRTEVYLLYSSTHLYIGAIFYDEEPDKIAHSVYQRDGLMLPDDSFIISIDANNDNRTAIQLGTNANGARLDREVGEGGTTNPDFDFDWRVETSIDERGIIFEIEIPFYALSFQPAEENEMGLLLRRQAPRKFEVSHWPVLSRDFNFTEVSEYGRMVGLKGINTGLNLRLAPSFIAGGTQSAGEEDLEADISFDARWGVTPNMILDFTANTDFAQVESDELQVNLTRFSLFYPEKRKFFLENSNAFLFGLRDDAEVFFSRRIGIHNGQKVPIVGGVRLNGIVGDTNIGFLSMQTDRTDFIDSENFTVGRIRQNFLSRSTWGAVYTKRSGFEEEADTTVGFDFRHVWGSATNIVFFNIAKSSRPQIDDGEQFMIAGYYYNSDLYEAFITYQDIGENFNPGIGFVRRPDQQRLLTTGTYRPRPSWDAVRQMTFKGSYSRIQNHAGILESENIQLSHTTSFESFDTITFEYTDDYELLTFPFEIAPGVIIPPGDYNFSSYNVGYFTSPARKLYSEAIYQRGTFYGGDIQSLYALFQWKVTPKFHLESFNLLNKVELPGGNFDNNVYRLIASYYLNPNLSLRTAAQYSSLEDHLVLNMRMRWIFGQGSEAWLVYDENRVFDLPIESLQNRALIAKFIYRF